MASYLLLRNNKESGPFTVEELRNFGLKPYDLIWVQGKSAAWRYPGEIDELRPFAPAVEEQPFDRFYKKKSDEVKEVIPDIDEKYSRYVPRPENEVPKHTPKRSVFVTLPGNKQVTIKNDREIKPAAPAPEPIPAPTISITENPAAAEIKYSQPLDEIKEMYVKTLLERKDKRARKGVTLAMIKKVAVVVGLVVIGVLAGMVIRSKQGIAGNDKSMPQLMDLSTSLTNKIVSDPATGEVVENNAPVQKDATIDNERQQEANDVATDEEGRVADKSEPTVKIRKETMIIVPKRKENYERQSNPGARVDPLTGERGRQLRSESLFAKEESESFASIKSGHSLKDLVSVESNDYKRVAFGGIRNLYLTVTNKSKYTLDNVIVELQYLKPSEEPLRTENITFKSIAPNASSTIRVPDTNRGIKVNYRIINIRSQETPKFVSGNE